MLRLAVIGAGGRITGMLGLMKDLDTEVAVTAVADPDAAGARQRLENNKIAVETTRFYPSAETLLEQADQYDGLLIGTRCHMHTPMACLAAPTKLPLFLEKPVAITAEQVAALAQAYQGREDSVVISFPLRFTPLFLAALEIVRSGKLGTINQIQAFNNVPYGGCYFGEWYRNYPEVGGLWLQKATHDFDYINLLAASRPTQIAATYTHLLYGGDQPHDLRCSSCDRVDTCPESPQALKARGDGGGMGMNDHWCAFSKEIKNEDAGSALVRYDSGAHACYSQNFVTRRSAGRRGAIITGYDGTVDFDWYTNQVRYVDHHSNRVDRIEINPSAGGGHGGGDHVLARNFIDLIRGQARSRSTLHDGLRSAALCLAARKSSETQCFQNLPAIGPDPA